MSLLQDAPIGLFDSGVGGLSVLCALRAELPQESLLYVADSANCPYGPRGMAEIRRLSAGISRYLLAQGVKAIVVACNTASAAALAHLRAAFPQVPFVGMVPAVKPAAQVTHSGVVGVLATPATFEGALYQDVVQHYAAEVRVMACACPGLVEQVEAGDLDGPATLALLRAGVGPLLEAGADTLVLGCTHYPFLIQALRTLVGPQVQILEPSAAVARHTAHVLGERGLLCSAEHTPEHAFATTGDVERFREALGSLLGWYGAAHALRWQAGRLV